MKKLGLLCAAVVATVLGGADIITPESFVANFKNSYKTGGFTLQDNVVKVTALPQGKLSPEVYKRRSVQQSFIFHLKNLKAAELPGAVFKLEFETKITKLSGRFEVCVRMVKNDGESHSYPGVTFRKWNQVPEWKKFSKTFKVPQGIKALQFYMWATYFVAGDEVQVRNVKFTRLK